MQLSDLGTDIDSNYVFIDGDLKLIDETDNLGQSIVNRLNTPVDSMSVFYNNYGSMTRQYLGERTTQRMLDFLQLEVKRTLEQDPRLQDISIETSVDTVGVVHIDIDKVFDDDTDLSLNLVMTTENGVSIMMGDDISGD